MISGQRTKSYVMITPQALTATDKKLTGLIDSLGWDYLNVYLIQDAPVASNTALVSGLMDIGEATASDGTYSTVAAVSNSSYSAAATVNEHHRFHVDLRGRKRWLNIQATYEGGTTTIVAAIGILERGDVDPVSAATAGTRSLQIG